MSNLAEVLKSLSKSEFRDFGKFIRSPYFNNRNEVVRFYDTLKKFHPAFKSNSFTDQNLFASVYPGKKFSSTTMRKLNSLMLNLVMDYLNISDFRKETLEYNCRMLDKLRQKKLFPLFEKKAKIIENLLQGLPYNFQYYEQKFKYQSVVNGYFLIQNEKSMVNKLQVELDDFIIYFLLVSLLQYIRLSEWARAYNIKFDLKFREEVTKYISTHNFDNNPLISLYYNMLMLLDTSEEKYYFELKNFRNKLQSRISKTDDYNVAIVLMQYCNKRVQQGDSVFRKHQLDITKMLLKENLIPDGFLEPYFFTNTIRNASYLKEYKWSEDFIEKYKDKLNPDFAEETVKYSRAMINFSRGRFNDALELLSSINIKRSNMKIDMKNIQLMIYYELNYNEELFYLIDTYKHYLFRDKEVTKLTRDRNSGFLNYITLLLKARLSGSKKVAGELNHEIKKLPYFIYKDWLLEKTDKLLEKKLLKN